MRCIHAFLFFFLTSFVFCAKAKVIDINREDFKQNISNEVAYKLVDNQWEAGGVTGETGWLKHRGRALNFGLINKGVWLRFSYKKTIHKRDVVFLVIKSSLIDTAKLYNIHNNAFNLIDSTGLGFSNIASNADKVLTLKSDHDDYYVYVSSSLGLVLPLWLYAKTSYQQYLMQELLIFGFITGIFMVIFLYNMFLFISLKNWSYLFYCLYICGVYLTQALLVSVGYQFFGLRSPIFNLDLILYATTFMGLFSCLFIWYFFKRHLYHSIYFKSLYRLLFVACFLIPISNLIFGRLIAFYYVHVTIIYSAVLILVTSIIMYKRGVRKARFITYAWFIFLVGSVAYFAGNLGIIPYTYFSQYTMLIGAIAETVLISLALSFRVHELQQERKDSELILLNQSNAKQQLELDKTRAEMKALRSQMNPHFIFNGLNSVHAHIELGEPKKAGEMLLKFAKLMRKTLEHSREERIPLKEEIDFLKMYLALEGDKGRDVFDIHVDVDPDLVLEDIMIPPTLIQPLCENAIKHAFGKPNAEKYQLWLTIKGINGNKTIRIEVRDNGVGFESEEALFKLRSHGLSLVHERIALMQEQGIEAKFDIFWQSPNASLKGTTVIIEMPVI